MISNLKGLASRFKGVTLVAFTFATLSTSTAFAKPPSGDRAQRVSYYQSSNPTWSRSRDAQPEARSAIVVRHVNRSRRAQVHSVGASERSGQMDSGGNATYADGELASLAPKNFRRAKNVWISPAGLHYGSVAYEGHRFLKVLRHTHDIPERDGASGPGYHGVFDGDTNTAFALIDRAYKAVKANADSVVDAKLGRRRSVYIIDMGRRIGYLGGKLGGELGNPETQKLCLVLDNDNVISAYPAFDTQQGRGRRAAVEDRAWW